MAFKTDEKTVETSLAADVAFDAAFGEAVSGNPTLATPEPDPEPTPADPTPEPDPEPTPADPTPAPAPDAAALQARVAELEAKIATPPASAPTPALVPEPKAFELPTQTDEEKAAWDSFKLEYPEVAQAMEGRTAKLEAAVQNAVKFINEQLEPLKQQIAPLADSVAKTAEEKFMEELNKSHSDAKALYPELEKWIGTLPRHRAIGANTVLDRGTAQDVVELYTEFKQATGRAVQASNTPEPEPEPLPPATQNRLQRLEAVPTRRTNHQEPDNPDDFDGAFAQAVASIK